jgi:hypothetical protein
MTFFRFVPVALLFVVVSVAAARAETISVTTTLDRWMYPFAFSGGTRDLAPTFGAVGTPGFDNRDGQFVVGFNTGSQVPINQGTGNYQIQSVVVRALVGLPADFLYDPTYDSYRTYLPSADPQSLPDADAGRPIELHGLGFRNGYTALSFGPNDSQPPGFEETSPFGSMGTGTRHVYPIGFLAGSPADVSNNVGGATESNPWAIGTTSISPGSTVPANSIFAFNLNLSDPDIAGYLQSGLNSGVLGFAITSLHEAAQTGGPPVPQWITKENAQPGAMPATLEINYQIVPEPRAIGLALVGCAAIPVLLWRRARNKFEASV